MLVIKIGDQEFATPSLQDAETVLRILSAATKVKTRSVFWPRHAEHIVIDDYHHELSVAVLPGTPVSEAEFTKRAAASEEARKAEREAQGAGTN
jgi:hypothetical protein